MVVDWGKRGMLSKPAGLISLVRKRGLEMPVLLMLRRKRLEDIPVEVLNHTDGTIFLSEETPEFIARNLVSRLRNYAATLKTPVLRRAGGLLRAGQPALDLPRP